MRFVHHHPRANPSLAHSQTTANGQEADDLGLTDHDIAAQLPPGMTAVMPNGDMDNHRKPIISIHGKDVDEHEPGHHHA